jgi:hypothetical protein
VTDAIAAAAAHPTYARAASGWLNASSSQVAVAAADVTVDTAAEPVATVAARQAATEVPSRRRTHRIKTAAPAAAVPEVREAAVREAETMGMRAESAAPGRWVPVGTAAPEATASALWVSGELAAAAAIMVVAAAEAAPVRTTTRTELERAVVAAERATPRRVRRT